MTYAGSSDLEARLGSTVFVQLTDDAGTGVADETKAAEALATAEGEVNSYLGRRYAVPVDVARHAQLAALLRNVTVDLAAYRLHARRPPVPDELWRHRSSAIGWLERLADGRAVLPATTELAGNEATGIVSQATGVARRTSADQLEHI